MQSRQYDGHQDQSPELGRAQQEGGQVIRFVEDHRAGRMPVHSKEKNESKQVVGQTAWFDRIVFLIGDMTTVKLVRNVNQHWEMESAEL